MMMAFENMIGEPSSTQVCFEGVDAPPTGEMIPWCSRSGRPRQTHHQRLDHHHRAVDDDAGSPPRPGEIRLADTPMACIRMKANSSDRGSPRRR